MGIRILLQTGHRKHRNDGTQTVFYSYFDRHPYLGMILIFFPPPYQPPSARNPLKGLPVAR
jgi:hypothetical protein